MRFAMLTASYGTSISPGKPPACRIVVFNRFRHRVIAIDRRRDSHWTGHPSTTATPRIDVLPFFVARSKWPYRLPVTGCPVTLPVKIASGRIRWSVYVDAESNIRCRCHSTTVIFHDVIDARRTPSSEAPLGTRDGYHQVRFRRGQSCNRHIHGKPGPLRAPICALMASWIAGLSSGPADRGIMASRPGMSKYLITGFSSLNHFFRSESERIVPRFL